MISDVVLYTLAGIFGVVTLFAAIFILSRPRHTVADVLETILARGAITIYPDGPPPELVDHYDAYHDEMSQHTRRNEPTVVFEQWLKDNDLLIVEEQE